MISGLPPLGFGAGLALGSEHLRLANFAGPTARRAAPCAHVCASCGQGWMPGSGTLLGGPGSSQRPGAEPLAGDPEEETGGSCSPPHPGWSSARAAPGKPGRQPWDSGFRRRLGRPAFSPSAGTRVSAAAPASRSRLPLAHLGSRCLEEPGALGCPGSASSEPLCCRA